MIVLAYFLTQWFGIINGLGIASMCWLLSMELLTRRLEHREAKAHTKYQQIVYERTSDAPIQNGATLHVLRWLKVRSTSRGVPRYPESLHT